MASDDAFFKIRPTKRSNPEARTTLDSLHSVRVNTLLDRKKSVDILKKEMIMLEEQCREIKDEVKYEQYQKKIRDMENEIKKRNDGNE